MNDLAASSSFEVNCSMLATESSKDNLQRSPKRFQSAFWKLKLVVFTLELKLDVGVENMGKWSLPHRLVAMEGEATAKSIA
ncbi:hypothetical protein PoB_003377000 [Plakobranchus ocellatus]|uniref:Uncharacterized protein n=1 Tax=Plakobranchus ocellatus TaxID=259542 RepID=A0AAV4AIV9_9GAST|nr:hypothetical protein PoB_003377000 [Plakobranchus ocellatus]